MAEPSNLNLRAIAVGALAIAAGMACAVLAAWGLLRLLGPAANVPPAATLGRGGPAAPRLQSAPQPERAAYAAAKTRLLQSYGWVDRQAGIARIPLDEAMRLTAARAGGKEAGHGAP